MGSEGCAGGWFCFHYGLVCPLLGVSHCLLPFLWLKRTGVPMVMLSPSGMGQRHTVIGRVGY